MMLAGSLKAAVNKAISSTKKKVVVPPVPPPALSQQHPDKNHRIRVITASVRTTNRINALLNESMQSQQKAKKTILKGKTTSSNNIAGGGGGGGSDEMSEDGEPQQPKQQFQFYKNNFTMDHIYNLIENIIEDRLRWDRFNRMYDPWKSVHLAESLAKEIKEAVKTLNHDRHRIVCLTSVIEKQYQGLNWQMNFLMDEKLDNFTTHVHERATYNIVTLVFLVYKE